MAATRQSLVAGPIWFAALCPHRELAARSLGQQAFSTQNLIELVTRWIQTCPLASAASRDAYCRVMIIKTTLFNVNAAGKADRYVMMCNIDVHMMRIG